MHGVKVMGPQHNQDDEVELTPSLHDSTYFTRLVTASWLR